MLLLVAMTIFLGSFSANAQSNNWKSTQDAKTALKPVILSIEQSAALDREEDPQLYANKQAVLNLCNTVYSLIYRQGKSTQEAFQEATSAYNSNQNTQTHGLAGTGTTTKPGANTNTNNSVGPDARPYSVFAPQGLSITVNPVPEVRSLLTN